MSDEHYVRDPVINSIFRVFEEAAQSGDKCPTFAEVASRLQCGRATVDRACARLKEDKRIVFERSGNNRRARILCGPMAGYATGWYDTVSKLRKVFADRRVGACQNCGGDIVKAKEGQSKAKFEAQKTCSRKCHIALSKKKASARLLEKAAEEKTRKIWLSKVGEVDYGHGFAAHNLDPGDGGRLMIGPPQLYSYAGNRW